MNTKDFNSKRRQLEMGILVSLVLVIWNLYSTYPISWYFVAGCLFVSLISPIFWRPFAFVWMGLARILNRIFQTLMLAVLYYLVVSPVGLIRRYLGKDPLGIREFKRSSDSAYIFREKTFTKDDLKRLF